MSAHVPNDETFFVTDPMSFSLYMLDEPKKTIEIFGEKHYFHKPCLTAFEFKSSRLFSIQDYLEQLFSNHPNTTFDLFLESFHPPQRSEKIFFRKLRQDTKYHKRGLTGLRKRYDVCAPKYDDLTRGFMKKRVYGCPPNVRVHLCDIRHLTQLWKSSWTREETCVIRTFQKVIVGLLTPPTKSTTGFLRGMVDYLDKFLYDQDSVHYHVHVFATYMRCLKIEKQLDHIPDKTLTKLILNTCVRQQNTCLKKIHEKFPILKHECLTRMSQRRYDQYPSSEDTSCSDIFSDIQNLLLQYTLGFMDMYLMGRMFRQFRDGTTSGHCIVYVGDQHAELYGKILKKYGITPQFEYPSSPKQQTGQQQQKFNQQQQKKKNKQYMKREDCVQVPCTHGGFSFLSR